MIHFELIFVTDVKFMSRFIFLYVNIQLFHLRKRLSLLNCIAFAPCQRLVDYIDVCLFLSCKKKQTI